MSRLADVYEREHEELRKIPRGDLAAERARVAADAAARKADAERVAALLNARPAWQQQAGIVDVAALREREHQAWVAEAARQQAATRRERWRAYVGEHPNSVDAWDQPKNNDPDIIPEWFE